MHKSRFYRPIISVGVCALWRRRNQQKNWQQKKWSQQRRKFLL